MSPYPSGSGSRWAPGPATSPADLDGLLAGAGYRVRASDLYDVARNLERLDSAIGSAPQPELFGDHSNPSDLTAWVDSMLSEVTAHPDPPAIGLLRHPSYADKWTDQIIPPDPSNQIPTVVARHQEEEDSGIRLVHLLMSCADSVQRSEPRLAANLLEEMGMVLARVNTRFGIGKVAGYFADAISRRLYFPAAAAASSAGPSTGSSEHELLYHHFYEACPYLKFAHFTANQAILEAFHGHDRVHVVDFGLMQGLQWPALIQALALRPGGPPFLRLTGIGPPSPDGRDSLREVGLRLAELARSVHVRFTFRGVAANRLDDVRPWMLQVAAGEAIAVNSVLQLHRLLSDPGSPSPVESVLGWIAELKPKIVTLVEQEADHNKPAFLDRFTEALFYYSTIFDSLEGAKAQTQQQSAALAEVYLQREICNIVCCEGASRVERHEPLAMWRTRMGRTGFSPVHLGSNAFKQASMLLTLFSGEGYCVEEDDGCLTLGWHSRPLISASAWRADDSDGEVEAELPESNVTINSNGNGNNTFITGMNSNNNKNVSTSSSSSSNNNGGANLNSIV
ncbi:putative DELLA protein SLN1 [Iris pallida]|uniref:DELLA protein n=1 Tax=Iris pallida TaxID=29817 RepID=A0AAX6FTJ6_IRIPA|nr:putative DELLA protein SLN1 [Iris pallida]